ncbi:MAG: monomeric [FeFe] hydrogenase, partial [Clostridiales bacterium]|nr:monomeric [FeFe] hydrogenase [Clostridiales bacterium]
MRIFDTNVQKLKYEVLKALIKNAYEHDVDNIYTDIPKLISPGPKASLRCCIYKERAILQERIKLALGGDRRNPNVVEVIDIACDECPAGGIFVTPSCRGCIVHRCLEVCPKNAIAIIDKKAVIDKSICVECGKCTKACPYSAIIKQSRPCVTGCPTGAISVEEESKKAHIDNGKCIACGACVYQCPFGAISDKSYISEVIELLKSSDNNEKYKVYAVVAPSIVSQFKYAKIEQVVGGIKQIGFFEVVEAALGADIVVYRDFEEWKKTGKLLSSCCPSFVEYVEKNFPELKEYISDANSPMVETGLLIKRGDPSAKVVFIGPCCSKKAEYRLEKTRGAIDCAMSFEELQAFFDARDVDVAAVREEPLDNASYYGRIFARSGGVAKGVTDLAKSEGVDSVKAAAMSGIEACKINLLKLKAGVAAENFFEGMACEGGCINGALCLNRGPRNLADVDNY